MTEAPWTRAVEVRDAGTVAAAMSQPGHRWVVALVDGRVVGYASAEEQREAETPYKRARAALHVHAMAVLEAERGRGIGRALMAGLRVLAARDGLGELTLEVYAFNDRARDFYAREGFVPLRALLVSRPDAAP